MFLETDHYHLPTGIQPPAQHRVQTHCEQGSGDFNEDVVLAKAGLYGVFDGATSLVRETFEDGRKSGGLLAASIAARAFWETCGSLVHRAKVANQRIAMAQQACGIEKKERHRLWSTSLAVLQLGKNSFEYCQTGDAMVLLLYYDGSYRLLTPTPDIDAETLSRWQQAAAAGATDIYQALGKEIRRVRLEMNISYGVLNGEEQALGFLRHGREPLDGISDILLFTDGLFLPRRSPRAANDWGALAAIYRRYGLCGLRDHVRSQQDADPDCREYPRFKRHDDIAAVVVSLQPEDHPAMALA